MWDMRGHIVMLLLMAMVSPHNLRTGTGILYIAIAAHLHDQAMFASSEKGMKISPRFGTPCHTREAPSVQLPCERGIFRLLLKILR